MKRILIGQILLIICCIFYLVWWYRGYRPGVVVSRTGGVNGVLLFVTAAFGVAGLICSLTRVQTRAAYKISPMLIVVGGITLYFALLLITRFVFQRIVTTELFLIVGWIMLEMTVINRLHAAEILTNNNAKPSRDWVNIVATPSARAKIRKYFASVTRAGDMETGRNDLAHELRKRGYGISTPRVQKACEKVLPQFDVHTVDDLMASIGAGKYTPKIVANRLEEVMLEGSPEANAQAQAQADREEEMRRAIMEDRPLIKPSKPTREERKKRSSCGVIVKGDPDLMVHLAHCCNPVAGDDIVGFVTRGRGVSVHRANCPNVKGLMEHPERMIDVEWDTSGATEFQVEIVVEASDRMGLLKDVTIAINDSGGNILSAATQTSAQGVARLRFLIAISDASLLMPLLANVSRVPSVFDARRIMPGEGSSQMKRRL